MIRKYIQSIGVTWILYIIFLVLIYLLEQQPK